MMEFDFGRYDLLDAVNEAVLVFLSTLLLSGWILSIVLGWFQHLAH